MKFLYCNKVKVTVYSFVFSLNCNRIVLPGTTSFTRDDDPSMGNGTVGTVVGEKNHGCFTG
jgi:hypothetical protein